MRMGAGGIFVLGFLPLAALQTTQSLADEHVAFIGLVVAVAVLMLRVSQRHVDRGITALDAAIAAQLTMGIYVVVVEFELLEASGVEWLLALPLGGAVATALLTNAKLVAPLLRLAHARRNAVVMLVGMAMTILCLLFLEALIDPVGHSAVRTPLLLTCVLGLALWLTAAVRSELARLLGTECRYLCFVHASGLAQMSALLWTHVALDSNVDLHVASLAGGILALGVTAARTRHSASLERETFSLEQIVVLVLLPLIAIAGAAIAWLYASDPGNPWLGSALVLLCGALLMVAASSGDWWWRIQRPANSSSAIPADLRLHYQPVTRVSDGAVVAVEALLRGRDTRSGSSVPVPDVVWQLGQHRSFDRVTDFVLHKTFQDGARILAEIADPEAFVSLNLSPHEAARPDLIPRIEKALDAVGCSPDGFALEVTEHAVGLDGVYERLGELQDRGFLIVLDGFGAGYSNLSALADFEFDVAKIDRCVVDAAADPRSDEILRNTIDILSSSGALVAVSGIDSHHHEQAVWRHRPDLVQGNAIAAPMSATDLIRQLQAQTRPMRPALERVRPS